MSKKPDNHRPLSYVLFKKYGLRGALQILREDVCYDLINGLNTAAPVSRSKLFPCGQIHDQNRYVASTFGVLDHTLDFASKLVDVSHCGFVDLGSGKGKALIHAASYPFSTLRGIEVSPLMHRIARKNLHKLHLLNRVELQLASAANSEFQPHERVIYLFNSFTGDILQQCMERLVSAGRDGNGVLIYVNPTEHRQIEAFLEPIKTVFTQPGNCEVTFFHIPANNG